MSDIMRPREKNLMPLSFIKFCLQFSVLITTTAYYMNVVTANNPWSMVVMDSSPSLMGVVIGGTAFDTFYTIATMLAFYKINNYLDEKERNVLTIKEILQLYLKRFLRYIRPLEI